MTMMVAWRRVLECLDEVTPQKASEVSRRCRDAGMSIGMSTDWVARIGMPEFERSGCATRVRGSRPLRWVRTPAGTGAIAEALADLHEAAKDKLRADFEQHGEAAFFPDNSTSHTYEAQREAIRLGWIAIVQYPSPKLSITEAGRAALAVTAAA